MAAALMSLTANNAEPILGTYYRTIIAYSQEFFSFLSFRVSLISSFSHFVS